MTAVRAGVVPGCVAVGIGSLAVGGAGVAVDFGGVAVGLGAVGLGVVAVGCPDLPSALVGAGVPFTCSQVMLRAEVTESVSPLRPNSRAAAPDGVIPLDTSSRLTTEATPKPRRSHRRLDPIDALQITTRPPEKTALWHMRRLAPPMYQVAFVSVSPIGTVSYADTDPASIDGVRLVVTGTNPGARD